MTTSTITNKDMLVMNLENQLALTKEVAEVQAYAAAHPEMEVVWDEQQHIYIPKELEP